jgi:AraC-like DNA-binding protein
MSPMASVPLGFVNAVLLVIVAIRLATRADGSVNRLFLATIAVAALQSVLLGLRWGYGIETFRPLQLLLASIIPPLAWIGFSRFAAAHAPTLARPRLLLHLLPPLAIALIRFARPSLTDVALVLVYLGYGTALLVLARSGPDGLDRVKLDGAIPLHRALQITGIALLVRGGGLHAARFSGLGGLCFLVLLGWAAVAAGQSKPAPDEKEAPAATAAASPPASDADDARVVADLDALMQAKALYRNPELSLDLLARKLVIPSRRISTAVNRVRAMNVSQYVNEHRIADACRRLSETDEPITQILFEVGFQTKSNFNREFLRLTGRSPSAWRAERKQAGGSAQMRPLFRSAG